MKDYQTGGPKGEDSRLAHTAEQWTVTHNSWDVSTVYASDGNPVAIVEIDGDVTEDTQEKYEAEKEGRARLIVTAPDGYALAEAVVAYFGDDDIDPKLDGDIFLRASARALLAKARGQS